MRHLILTALLFTALASFGQSDIYSVPDLYTRINTEIVPNGQKAITGQQLNKILNGFLNVMPSYSNGLTNNGLYPFKITLGGNLNTHTTLEGQNFYDFSFNNIRTFKIGAQNLGLNLGGDQVGDMYYRNASGYLGRLAPPVGITKPMLTFKNGLPAWDTASSGSGSGSVDLSNYPTRTELIDTANAIRNNIGSGGTIDLSNYYTKTEVNNLYTASNGITKTGTTFGLGGRLNNGFTTLTVAPDQSFNWENGIQLVDSSNASNLTQLGAGVLYSNYEDGSGGNSQIYTLGANFYLNNYFKLGTANAGTASISTGSSANHGYLRLGASSFNKGSSNLILQSDTAQVLLQATGDGTQTSVFKVTSTRTQNLNSLINNIYVHDDTPKIGGYYLLVDSLKKQATGYHLAYNPATQRVTYDSTGGSGTTYTTTDKNLLIAGSTISTNKTPLTLTDAATVTWDLSQGYNANVTIAGNRTIALSNPQAGSYYKLTIVQDATGSRTVTWPATVKWKGGTAPTLTTTGGAKDIVVLYYDGSNFQTVYGLDFK